ncbi:protein of unknown function [Candidatus Nitrosotalea okcheonensis]|uniref:Uncharacterized protein n=1 Tax=Candidatus Nitrosotalea okcheonensis TaxID=1903276 RepID=A0A2H1FF29_9ARCH|nr:protein of unknown function [Candidatus Nitrosotalea okcheonensis]
MESYLDGCGKKSSQMQFQQSDKKIKTNFWQYLPFLAFFGALNVTLSKDKYNCQSYHD